MSEIDPAIGYEASKRKVQALGEQILWLEGRRDAEQANMKHFYKLIQEQKNDQEAI